MSPFRLGVLLCEIIRLPFSHSPLATLKQQAINLLIFMPPEYSAFLLANGCLFHLLNFLRLRLSQFVTSSQKSAAGQLTPLLIVLHSMAKACPPARHALHQAIFPNKPPPPPPDSSSGSSSGSPTSLSPSDSPPHSLRSHLISLMTDVDVGLKRYASELLFEVCGGDAEEFTARTGLGNAIALLQLKGIVG